MWQLEYIVSRGEDLAYFSPRRFFPTTFVYFCSKKVVHIGGFTSCGFVRLATMKEECRISSLCTP